MEDPEDAERDRRNRERFVIVFTVWAEDIRDRLETDASFFRRVEASWLTAMVAAGQFRAQHPELERDDLFDEDQAVWRAVHAVLDTLKAERETRSAR